MNRIWKMTVLIFAIILVDQLTKGVVQSSFFLGESMTVVDGFFNFTYVRNPGAAFGFLAKGSLEVRQFMFLFLPVLACIWLVVLICQVSDALTTICMHDLIHHGNH